MAQQQLQVLILTFQGLNTLDLCGPSEVFANFALGPKAFKITIAASQELVTSFEGPTVQRHRSLRSLLEPSSDPQYPLRPLEKFDLLVVPGGPGDRVQAAIDRDTDIAKVIKKWSEISRPSPADPSNPWRSRQPLLSICTGAAFLGTLGLLGGKTCTTHFGYIPTLEGICKKAGKEANVEKKRFVDAGETNKGMRILTSGGISCGIDASLWIVGQLVGLEEARGVARMMDYRWVFDKDGEGSVTEGEVV
ncbi:hypothetical protein CKM354_000197500 [Cercospora kikuchii]|uniref:DJ-1/PfpI domain-containing protein n=1 Tax=Cercospora kikuchii TaxID=84275 RepID=A0A9P3C6Q7_9PEZI|nr:uncharacterized protein CKM354_000197500 [Cercospora kikuchii]GIZ38559.1 hypothetical protein CKM354_000197500 [Cercospora kikuchii]